jgi:hypothetical protein
MFYLLSFLLVFGLSETKKTMPTRNEIMGQISENRKNSLSSKSNTVMSSFKHGIHTVKNRSLFRLLDEDFESGMPAGWTVINGDGDSFTWSVGTFGFVSPPDSGTSYCYYNDDAAGENNISGDSIQTPILEIPDSITSLYLTYGYGHTEYEEESLKVQVKYHDGIVWNSWQQIKAYGATISGTDTIPLNENNDSLQVMWVYRDDHTDENWGWGSSFDNVLIEYDMPVENDVGMYSINSPVSDTTIRALVSVNGTVKNYGTSVSSFETGVNIFDPDSEIAFTKETTVGFLAPSETQNIYFGNVQLTKAGTYTVEMFTHKLNDENSFNDSLTTTFNSSDYFWQSIPSPGIRNHAHGVVYDPVNDLFFIVAGDSTGNQANMDICLAFDPKTNTWETKQPMPKKRGRHCAAYRNGFIHVLCGKDGNLAIVPNHAVYDINGNSWDTAASSPVAVTRPNAVTWKDSLVYLIGGYDETHTARTDVNYYNPETDSWHSATSLPRQLHAGASAIKGDSIFIYGGADGSTYYSEILLGEINSSDPTVINWSWGNSLPTWNASNGFAIKNNTAYMIGGVSDEGTNNVWEYDILDEVWTSLPDYPTPFIMNGDFAERRDGPDSLGIVYCFMGDTANYWSQKPTDECYRLIKIPFAGIEEDKTTEKNSIYLNNTVILTNEIAINCNISERCDLKICIYDVLGREVLSHTEKNIHSGQHKFILKENLKNGIYFIKIEAGSAVAMEKFILIR